MEDKNIILAPSARHMRNLMINLDDLVGELETRLEILEVLTDGLDLKASLGNPLVCTCGDCVQATKAIRKEVNANYRAFQYDLLNKADIKRLFVDNSTICKDDSYAMVPFYKVVELFGEEAAIAGYNPDYSKISFLRNGRWYRGRIAKTDKQVRTFSQGEFIDAAGFWNSQLTGRTNENKIYSAAELKSGCF